MLDFRVGLGPYIVFQKLRDDDCVVISIIPCSGRTCRPTIGVISLHDIQTIYELHKRYT